MASLHSLALIILLASAPVEGSVCGDGVCNAEEGWMECLRDCPRPPRDHLVPGTSGGTTTHIKLKRGETHTFYVRLSELPVEKLEVATSRTREKQLRVRKTECPGLLEPATCFTIYPRKLPVRRARIWLTVNREWLNGTGFSPGEMALFQKVDGGWEMLETSVSRTRNTVRFRAESGGLGDFGLASTQGITGEDTGHVPKEPAGAAHPVKEKSRQGVPGYVSALLKALARALRPGSEGVY